MKIYNQNIITLFTVLCSIMLYGQQDPQFTQYMFNTLSVNSAYAGSKGHLVVTGIHRSQWVGIDGAPRTQTLSVDTPIRKNVGLGFSVVNDQIGPMDEFFFDVNFSYTIKASETHLLSFGIKGGARLFNIDWSRGTTQNPDDLFQQNIEDRFFATVGAGIFLRSKRSYLGLSIPNFFRDIHYDDLVQSIAKERLHLFLIGGFVFDISNETKLKPAFLLKHVDGAPIIVDLSFNFLLYERLRLGVSYRWDDSFSGLVAFQTNPGLMIGYAYDYTTTELQRFTTGSHELMLRFELKSEDRKLKSPRFF